MDSIQAGRAGPGFIHELDAASLRRLTGASPHFLGVGETLALGGKLGLPMPGEVKIFAVETQDPFTLGTRMTRIKNIRGIREIRGQETACARIWAWSALLAFGPR